MKYLLAILALCLTGCQSGTSTTFINTVLDEFVGREFAGGPINLTRVTAIGTVQLQGDGVKFNPETGRWGYTWLKYTGGSPWTGSGTVTLGKVPQ